jgi:hypothetical protein
VALTDFLVWLASLQFWAIVLPFDVVKTRMQTEQTVGRGAMHPGLLGTFRMVGSSSKAGSHLQRICKALGSLIRNSQSLIDLWPSDCRMCELIPSLHILNCVLLCPLQIRKESGLSGLYAGLSPTLIRAFPANAAAIVAWELAARLLHQDR